MPWSATVDPIELSRALIRCPSITPVDAGALDVLQGVLQDMGFTCHRLPFADGGPEVDNLYARIGDSAPNFCFAGHTDVVPVGDAMHGPSIRSQRRSGTAGCMAAAPRT